MLFSLIQEMIAGETPIYVLLLQLLFSVIALLLVFPIHEFAHGMTAHLLGDPTAKYQGRLTLNPLAHVDLKGFLFLLVLGFGWAKPVQFDPRYFKNRRLGTIMTAAAGPLSNIVFCFITYTVYGILLVYSHEYQIGWLQYFSVLFYYMATYNASFAVFNLIPFPPLDGSKILGELLPFKLRYQYYNLERYSFIFFPVLVLLMHQTNFLGILSNGLMYAISPLVYGILGGLFG